MREVGMREVGLKGEWLGRWAADSISARIGK